MPLVLFLGNSIYAEDRIGLLVGEILKEKLQADGFEVEILESIGYTLIDYIVGKDFVIVVDSIIGEYGEVTRIEDLKNLAIRSPKSPHFAGILEAIELMKALNLSVPNRILVLGIGVRNPYVIGDLSPELFEKLEDIAKRVYCEIRNTLNLNATRIL